MSVPNRDDILRKVQALLAKAMSTPFEAEADTFRQKANEMMDKYRLEQWELAQVEAGRARSSLKPVRKDVNIAFWWAEHGAFGSTLWSLYKECAAHCAVILATMKYNATNKTVPAYGLESDISFLEMLFTDLYIQMADKIKPQYDPSKSLGENVYRAKEAGMKYKDICHWIGRPELIKKVRRWDDRREKYVIKTEIDGILIREMKKYASANGLTVHKSINLDGYIQDFCDAFGWAVKTKLREMRTGEVRGGESMALAIKDITDLSREEMWEDFPDMRPHPPDCQCDRCHFLKCTDPKCQRTRCVEARKPIKKRSYGRTYARQTNVHASARGAQAGQSARIMGKNESLGHKKGIDK
jgi:hypothetical protein